MYNVRMSGTVCYHPFHLDRQARFTSPASHIAKALGYRSQEIEGERMDRFVRNTDGPAFLEAMLDAYRGKKVRGTCVDMITLDKRFIEVDIQFEPEGYDIHGNVISIKGTICRCKQREK
jgi:hypothetical protein